MIPNKAQIQELLETNDKAVIRALVLLKERQTFDEQQDETTRYRNGRGFRPCHAKRGVSMAKFFEERGFLTPKQIAYWRVKDVTGTSRLGIYWGQLQEEAIKKASAKFQ